MTIVGVRVSTLCPPDARAEHEVLRLGEGTVEEESREAEHMPVGGRGATRVFLSGPHDDLASARLGR